MRNREWVKGEREVLTFSLFRVIIFHNKIFKLRGTMERRPNEEQQRVIEDLDENLIVFASAGTGKTFTIANRVSRILKEKRAKAEEVLLLTFTIKACEEMREDLARYVGEEAKNVEIRTIHGFCYRLLKEENRLRGKHGEVAVCDEVDGEELIKSILSSQYEFWKNGEQEDLPDREFEIAQKKGKLYNFISALKHVREEQKFYTENAEEDYQKAFDYIRRFQLNLYDKILSISTKRGVQVRDHEFESAMQRFAGRLAFTYDDYLRKSGLLDYDDLIIFASRYLDEEQTLARWSTRYRYIVVDEMQDTSLLEYSVLKRVFAKNNVMMCGDFFQSIYGWRGSRPEAVLGAYVKEYAPKTYMFSENYRSTKTLTEASFGYLQATYPALVGKYCPEEIKVKSVEEGGKVLLLGFDNRREEAYKIYRYLKKLSPEQRASVCVMARSNFYLSSLQRAFEEFNGEYADGERLRFFTAEEELQFFRKPVVKDALAVVKLLCNRADRVSMERLAEKYVRLVGLKTIEQIRLQNRVGASIVSFLDKQTYAHGDPYHVLIESCREGNIVVYDTETTGLDLARDQMVQLSAIRIDCDGNIVDTFDKMIVPTVPIDKGAYETHGFDMDYVRANGVSAKEALMEFSVFVEGATLVGHNSFRFDRPLIKRQLKENGLPPLKIAAEYDTLAIAKEFHGTLPDFRLSTLCFKYGVVNENAHNAYGDIVATGQVLVHLIREDILPTAMERRNICQKHKDKFEKFYVFFSELENSMEKENAENLLSRIFEKMGLWKKYTGDSDRRAMESLLKRFREGNGRDTETFLREYLANAEFAGRRADQYMAQRNAIPLLTVHQSKGCEFDTVIIAGADDRNFPSFLSKGENAEEEEKKVFYVAISRAKKKLILTKAAYNGREELFPSPYAKNIPEKHVWKNERWDVND